MSLNLISFVKRLMPTLSKSDLESDLDVSLDAIAVVLSVHSDLNTAYTSGKFNSTKAKDLVDEFYKEFSKIARKDKLHITKKYASDTIVLFTNAKQNGEKIKREVADISNEVIVTQAITAAKANIVRAVGHYYFITKYSLDLINYIYTLEAEQAKVELPKDSVPNAKQVEFVKKNLWLYARMLAVYGSDPKYFQDELEALTEIVIPKEVVEDVVAQYSTAKVDIFDNLPSGFIGSPIYTVRLVFAQWEADRYKQLKDKRKLLELRYLYLRMLQEQGGSDANTEKEMGYLQKRITDIDYKTSKIEESVE